jgi:rSAM/selenodomain-associated transferase 2
MSGLASLGLRMSTVRSQLSVVIPALNAGATIAATLGALSAGRPFEVIVSDGGSRDATLAVAHASGAQTLIGLPGRGGQLLRGAGAAQGDWLLFLHADTQLPAHWPGIVRAHIENHADKAGYFQFALDDTSSSARRLERMVAWRSRVLNLPYGDQGLLISRDLYDAVGGFRDMPLMEDVDFIRRIGAKRLRALPCPAITSAARFQRAGYWARSARNVLCLGLYFAGASPHFIKRVYG